MVSEETLKDVQRIRLRQNDKFTRLLDEYRFALERLKTKRKQIEVYLEDTLLELDEEGFLQ